MTDEEAKKLKGILSAANKSYCDSAKDYCDEISFEKYKRELLNELWVPIFDFFQFKEEANNLKNFQKDTA